MSTRPVRRRRAQVRRRLAGSSQAGMVTAEIAAAMPALVLVLLTAVWTVAAATTQLRVADAAREGARALARGESEQVVRELVAAVAPDGATATWTRSSDVVEIVVRADVAAPVPFGDRMWQPTMSGSSTALAERG